MGTERGLDPLWSLCPLKTPACGILGPENSEVETALSEVETMGGVFEGSGRGAGFPQMGHLPLGQEGSEERGRLREP